MKNQYFGDRTDYIKHSLLHNLSNSEIQLAIHWTRTVDDYSKDGSKVAYLHDAENWRKFDPKIFDSIKDRVLKKDRQLNHFENFGFIRCTSFCYDLWESDPIVRQNSIVNFLAHLQEQHLVFMDPDNGIEVVSIRKNSRNSNKYVFFEEILKIWNCNHSIAVYQHYPRINRIEYLHHRFSLIRENMVEVDEIFALSTSFAAFIFVPKPKHALPILRSLVTFSSRWHPHVSLFKQEDGAAFPEQVNISERLSNQLEMSF